MLARGEDHLVCRDDDGRVTVLAWQPVGGSDDGPYGSAPASHEVTLRLPVASDVAVVRRSVNETEGNAWTAWRELGRPAEPVRAGARPAPRRLGAVVRHFSLEATDGHVDLDLVLGQHEVTLVELLPVTPDEHPGLDDRRLLGQDVVG